MARLARVVALDTPHHITQRGNGRQYILESDTDRLVYLDLLRKHCRLHRLSLLGYCLMSNHVHLIAVPERDDSLRLALKHTHGRYAAYFNARCASSGHVWQGRYYSCPLDLPHLWAALRYTELNPVRAGMVEDPDAYPWSSAAAHCGGNHPDAALDMQLWRQAWTTAA
jgi:putative transposase